METEKPIDPKRTVEDVLREHPPTISVFAAREIDLCCGGKHSLELVAVKHKIRLETLLAELEAAAKGSRAKGMRFAPRGSSPEAGSRS